MIGRMRNPRLHPYGGSSALLICALFVATNAVAQPVTIDKSATGYRLLRNGKPYFIKGAGGSQRLDVLAASGGNSIRTWRADPAVLEQAQARGLTVLMGLRV